MAPNGLRFTYNTGTLHDSIVGLTDICGGVSTQTNLSCLNSVAVQAQRVTMYR